jgi:hypothetical protein
MLPNLCILLLLLLLVVVVLVVVPGAYQLPVIVRLVSMSFIPLL